jgi:mRNA-degrading endonuclease toxin of MazEF toxin-antitoxin module
MERGDIYLVDLEPTRGKEQRGRRPVMVISRQAFNAHSPPWVCPIKSGGFAVRLAGFTVSLATTGLKTTGVVLCSQIRTLDLKERRGKRVERAPDHIIDEVMAVLLDILE